MLSVKFALCRGGRQTHAEGKGVKQFADLQVIGRPRWHGRRESTSPALKPIMRPWAPFELAHCCIPHATTNSTIFQHRSAIVVACVGAGPSDSGGWEPPCSPCQVPKTSVTMPTATPIPAAYGASLWLF